MATDLIELTVTLLHETEKAVLVSDGDTEDWLPKSQVAPPENGWEYWLEESVDLMVPEWLAIEKGFV